MTERRISRRAVLKSTGLIAVSGVAAIQAQEGRAQIAVPNSAGTEAPTLKLPANACDCHHHVYDAVRFPQPAEAKTPLQPNARVQEYRLLKQRLGITRDIVVTPSAYATDNRATLDAIARLKPDARGVAVVSPDISDAGLKALDTGGIRGIRFSMSTAAITPAAIAGIESLAPRVASLGWHAQFQTTADQLVELKDALNRIPCALVFDHMGHVPPFGLGHPAYGIVRGLIDKGRCWVKLSVTFDNSKDGPPGFADVTAVAQALVKAAPERLVWGSNWPHPNEPNKPDDAVLLDLLARWAPNEQVRHRILVENPETLYGFEPSK
ncbi:MAG TPA: amidohydrolase family protein [Rhizomicrobium sp.]|nr:amidohydrolase family protein [Rhizomicrobium sp.]